MRTTTLLLLLLGISLTNVAQINSVPLGSAGNLVTIIAAESNMIIVDEDINAIVFIHRNNEQIFGGNVSQYRYDISTDSGKTWTLNVGPLNPSAPQANQANGHHRYPQVTMHNPTGNTDPDSAYLVYLGATHDGTSTGIWDGISWGVGRLDGVSSTFTENSAIQNGGDTYIPAGLCKGVPGVFWAVDFANDGFGPSDILVYKGIFIDSLKDVSWTIATTITPPHDLSWDGTVYATSHNIAFDPSGKYGWIAFSGDICSGGTYEYAPVFYSTIDSGKTWQGPSMVILSQFTNVMSHLGNPSSPAVAFEADLVVDSAGNPHFGIVTGLGSSGYTIQLNALALFDFTWSSNDSGWMAIFLDTILNLRENAVSNQTQDNRIQMVTSPSGDKVFCVWADKDGSGTPYLNLFGKGIDINSLLVTSTVNFTKGDSVWDGKALFTSTSVNSFRDGTKNIIPTILTVPGSGFIDPAFFHYLPNVLFDDADFTIPIDTSTYVPSIIPANAGTDTTICLGISVPLSATGGNSYSWSPITGLSCSNCQNPIASPTVTTTYTVTVTDANCNQSSDDVMITVTFSPFANAGIDTTICQGDSVLLSASGGVSYGWSPGTGLTDSTIANPVAVPNISTTYIVTVTDTAGCTDTAATKLTVNPSPIANAGLDTTICLGETVTLSATGGTTYIWSPTTGLSNPNIANPVASPSTSTIYTVTVTDVNGCQDEDNLTITVDLTPPPIANFTHTDSNLLIKFTNTSSNAVTYFWNFGDGNTTVIVNPTHLYNTAGPYTVTLIVTNSCGADTMEETIMVEETGIFDFQLMESMIKIIPNPNTGKFEISFELNYKKNITLRILNLSGQLVYIEVIDAGESTSMKQIDLTALAKGIYHLQVITEDFVFNNKMIIQ